MSKKEEYKREKERVKDEEYAIRTAKVIIAGLTSRILLILIILTRQK